MGVASVNGRTDHFLTVITVYGALEMSQENPNSTNGIYMSHKVLFHTLQPAQANVDASW